MAAVIELDGLPMLEELNLRGAYTDVSLILKRERSFHAWMRAVYGLKMLFDAALSLPSFRALQLPFPLTSHDMQALADALEVRNQNGMAGLTMLTWTSISW